MNKNKIRIRLDLDEVLNEFSQHWMDLHYERTGERLKTTQWGMENISKYGDAIYDYFYEPNFFYDMPVKSGAPVLIDYLEKNIQYIDYNIVTSVAFTDDKSVVDYIKEQKKAWVLSHFGDQAVDKTCVVGKSKKGYPADIVVDDNEKHIIDSPKNALKILFQAEHNKKTDPSQFDDKTILGIRTLHEVQEIIREVLYQGSVSAYFENN